MDEIPLLKELVIASGVGAAITVLLSRLRVPPIAGLLFAGALLGPHGLAWIEDLHAIEVLAEVGVVLLLFTIGLEFSLDRLRSIFRQVALGGFIQVFGTMAATVLIARAIGLRLEMAVFYGFLFALSSTAIVLRALSYRGEMDAPHGRFIVGTLIFQDLCVVPMVLVVPALAGDQSAAATALQVGGAIGKAAIVIVGALAISRLLVPRLLAFVDASRSREVFLLSVITICIGTAWVTSLAGLSLALGAFLGGMVVADTEYHRRAMSEIIPLRDVFVSLFFISLGMFFDARLLVSETATVLILLLGFTAGKAALATLATVVMRFPARAAWLAGVGLGQFGEFGFVVLRLGESAQIISFEETGPLLTAGIISMFLAPVLIRVGPHITAGEKVLEPLTRFLKVRSIEQLKEETALSDHVIVVGYGIAGRMLGSSLAACDVRYVALELNAETVRRARSSNEPVYYADATSIEALEYARISAARAVVVLINDPQAATRVVDTVHRVAPETPILIRTRYQGERESLLALGAREVVAEEAEASVEIIARLLRRLSLPRNVIDEQISKARISLHTSNRRIAVARKTLPEALADLRIESVLLMSDWSAVGQTLRQLDLRRETRALVVAIRRDSVLLDPPNPDEKLAVDDLLFLEGTAEAIENAMAILESGRADH